MGWPQFLSVEDSLRQEIKDVLRRSKTMSTPKKTKKKIPTTKSVSKKVVTPKAKAATPAPKTKRKYKKRKRRGATSAKKSELIAGLVAARKVLLNIFENTTEDMIDKCLGGPERHMSLIHDFAGESITKCNHYLPSQEK